jgi:hypothetical protein
VLKLPAVRFSSELRPIAVLNVPVVRCRSTFCPSAVLPLG